MSITIKDIAKIAGVSHTTVSRALNDSHLVNDATKTKIKDIAKQYNYIPNVNARSLKLDKTYNIGLFFTSLGAGTSAGFFHKAVIGATNIIKDNYKLVIRGVEDYQDYSLITPKHFDGILLVSQSEEDQDFIRHCQMAKLPIVVVNRYVGDHSCILSDDRSGASKVVEYLIDKGHQRIAFIKGKKGFSNTHERYKGYKETLKQHGIELDESLMVNGDYSLTSGYEGMAKLLKQQELPTAVFCSNDEMAVGAMKAIQEKGLRVPEDISVVGYDESEFSRFTTPELTTVRRYIDDITAKGMTKLLKVADSTDVDREIRYIESKLIVGKSVIEI